jgi:hypothetical protein
MVRTSEETESQKLTDLTVVKCQKSTPRDEKMAAHRSSPLPDGTGNK